MKWVRCLLFVVIWLCGMTAVCAAMPAVKYQVDHNYPPYTFQNKNYLYGFDFSLATLIFDTTEYSIDYSAAPWEEVYPRLVAGKIDTGGIIAITEERKRDVLFTKPLFNSYVALYTLEHARTITVADLPQLRIGVGRGYYTESILRNTLGITSYTAYDHIEEALTDLAADKIDVIFENQQLMEYIIVSQNRKGEVVAQVTDLFPREHAYAVSKKRPELVTYMNQKIEELQESGVLEELYVKFFYTHSDTYMKARQQNWLYMLLIGLLFFAVAAALLKAYIDVLKRRLQVNYDQLMATHAELQMKEEALTVQHEELQAQEEELRNNYDRISYTARHDMLTGLPNRVYLHERLEAELEKARRGESAGAVLFIDLDDLKTINDSLGHRQGDALIIKSGALLVSEVGDDGFVSHIGGDEFIAILRGARSEAAIAELAERMLQALAYEHDAADIRLQLSASIGVALYPEHGDTADEILKNADNAMYAAKKAGKNCWRLYEASMQAETYEHMTLKAALRTALSRGELTVVYQPQVSAADHQVIGFEALLRWQSLQHGPVSPAYFIPLAEQTTLIHAIGEWVLQEAGRFAGRLADLGLAHIHVGVNVSPVQLAVESFVSVVSGVIAGVGIRPEQLELEITETALMSSLENVVRNLTELRAIGVRLALDDFGTGYSSLTYLHRLPVNTLKIDKSFIDMILTNTAHTSIIGNIVDMAHGMDMTVVAEGVETGEQAEFLLNNRCDFIQGYYFGRPVSADDAIRYLQQRGILP